VIAYVTGYRSRHNARERMAEQGMHVMKLHTYSAVMALGAAISLAACSSAPKPEPVVAPAVVAAPAPVASDPAQNQASHDLVQQVQTALKQDHLYGGRVDGAWGPRTQHGVTLFQKQHQLPTNGQLDDATLHAMNLQAPAPDTAAPATGTGNTDTAPPAGDDTAAPSTQP
jgi:peptidoglycan hydrolase-like protein with peptidoglycan-binding domain